MRRGAKILISECSESEFDMEICNGLVSVITPNYNCAGFIGGAIESVLSQTYRNWEMIIVDDCSSDQSCDIIESYIEKDCRIRLFKMASRSGSAFCRNLAIERSKGEFVAFLDSDDLWMPQKLDEQLRFMVANESDFCFTEYEHIDESGKSLGVKAKTIRVLTYNRMLYHCYPGCLTVVYNQKTIGKVFAGDVKKNSDHALFLRVLRRANNAMGHACLLARYRIRRGSISRNPWSIIQPYYTVLHDFEGVGPLKSAFCVFSHAFIKLFFKYERIRDPEWARRWSSR